MSVVLLHGLGGDRRQPLSLLGPVLGDAASIIAPDVRAHGTSPLMGEPADFTLDALAAEIAAEIAADLPPGPHTLIGISMGAALCLRLALRDDVAVERLVLIRPAFTDEPLPPNLAGFPEMGRLLQQHGPELAEEHYRDTDAYRALLAESPLGAEGALEQFRKPDAAARAIRLIEIPNNVAFHSAAELAPITAPTTIIAAPRDPVHPLAVAELWHAAMPHSTLEVLPARDDGLAAHTAATRAAVARAIAPRRPRMHRVLRALAVVVAGLVAGGLTSLGQDQLPIPIVSLANASGSWTLFVFAALLLARLRIAPAILVGVLTLIAMNEGYGLVSTWRGFPYSGGLTSFWTFAAIGVGPALGLASVWFHSSRQSLRALAVAAPSAVLIGEGVYGLLFLADVTSPVYWVLSILGGSALVGWTMLRRISTRSARAIATGATLLGAGTFVLAYSSAGLIAF